MESIKTLIILFLWCGAIATADDTLQKKLNNLVVATEEYPPISFKNKQGRADGLASEVAYRIMKKLNMKQSIHIWPWARDYKLLQKRPNYLVFSVSRTKQREELFHWVGPIYSMKTGFYTKKSSPVVIHNLEDAKKVKKIGTYYESFDEQFLLKHNFTNLESTDNNIYNIKKLMRNRFDVITATNVTIKAFMAKAGYTMDEIESRFDFLNVDAYFAFSKQVDEDVVLAWQKEFEKLQKSGELHAIQEKWLK